jgi:hypothetical protein
VLRAVRAWRLHRSGYPTTTAPVPRWPGYAVACLTTLDDEQRARDLHRAAREE